MYSKVVTKKLLCIKRFFYTDIKGGLVVLIIIVSAYYT